MFDVDEFIEHCRQAIRETEPRRATREVLDRALQRPDELVERFDPSEAGITLLHNDDELTVAHIVWAPKMVLYPHDHRMWAVIGIYAGQEDNEFFRRAAPGDGTIVESGGKRLRATDSVILGDDTIHSVANPGTTPTGAIHVYGGDFVRQPRSQWGPGERTERAFDLDEARNQFADANAAWHTQR